MPTYLSEDLSLERVHPLSRQPIDMPKNNPQVCQKHSFRHGGGGVCVCVRRAAKRASAIRDPRAIRSCGKFDSMSFRGTQHRYVCDTGPARTMTSVSVTQQTHHGQPHKRAQHGSVSVRHASRGEESGA